ncbi:MAG TPA: molybdopterin-dependent oxidoreductase, partial [Candidatus Angelobacter sp.]|nr:molybdopterin-dependent oxidoreductase [Candidatus Angelobacter sp.]
LGTRFGRGAATLYPRSMADSDCIVVMGSNMAENHPVGFQWVIEAREKNQAKIIHVDPRFTRTSAMADIWVPLRAGADVLFLGALINYVLTEGKDFREYVVAYTNASTILREDFRDTEDLGGFFSGWDPEKKKYHPKTWLYQGSPEKEAGSGHEEHGGGHGKDRGGEAGDPGEHESDPTLQHPRCIYQVLKKHFSRYTPEMVEQHCGVPKDLFFKVAEAYCSASGPEKTGAVCYAVGWTQHSNGVQIIRAASILQLLLGNMGRPGGGILALRGHASIQGSTDVATLYDILPGYLPSPMFNKDADSLKDYINKHRCHTGWWANFDKYIISFLKAYYGEAANKENDFRFNWLPRVTGDHSEFGFWLDMADGKLEGLFIMGQNPAVGAPNGRLERKALAKLKWLVVRDMVEVESASFWYNSPEVERGELDPDTIATEVFLMPAAGSAEKNGTFVNTQRLLQFHNKGPEPLGDSRSETWFMYHLGRRLKAKAAKDPSPRNAPLNALTWDYSTEGAIAEPSAEEVMMEINGWTVADHKLVGGYRDLKADGSTASGAWIYSGCFPDKNKNKANMREPHGLYGHGWGYAWPSDRRIIYNRASARPDGKPWSERKKLVWWDENKKEWTGLDTPDFTKDKAPDYKPEPGAEGDAALGGDKPFIMHPDGVGWIYVSSGLKDGPLPTHYEPLESMFSNPLYPNCDINPAALKHERPDNPYASFNDPRFPYVLTTYRLTEHHTAGGMSRTLSHLAELQPELFCEVSPALAAELGLHHGEYATITTVRGIVEARVMVTDRIKPLQVAGRTVHQIALPYHYGTNGLVRGDVVNDLLVISEEPNVRIMETKALLCDIRPGRRAQGKRALAELKSKLEQAA